jgi:transcription-repair coupling factor (superfamily II helicase)
VSARQSVTYAPIPPSAQGLLALRLAQQSGRNVLHLCVNDRQLEQTASLIQALAPNMRLLRLPAWDCLPYDRISPAGDILAQRLSTLCQLAAGVLTTPFILLTTVSAAMQKLPPLQTLNAAQFHLRKGANLNRDALMQYLLSHGYQRVNKVMEAGEIALRGNIIDLFPAGASDALRLDLFGDEIESLKWFDVLSQCSLPDVAPPETFSLLPVNEVLLNEASIEHFRSGYRARFGAITRHDALYESISAGRVATGMEHWMPLFYEQCDTLHAYLPDAILSYDTAIESVYTERAELLLDYYQARQNAPKSATSDAAPYRPLEPEALYLLPDAWQAFLAQYDTQRSSAFALPDAAPDASLRPCPTYAAKSNEPPETPFVKLKERLAASPKPIIIAAYSAGSAARINSMAADCGLGVNATDTLANLPKKAAFHSIILPIEHGFECDGFLLISEQDLLGERIIRTEKRKRAADAFLLDATSLSEGELVVHQEHGIGRFEGLITLEAGGVRADCLKLIYADDAKLFLPVLNMELLSRYGSDAEGVTLDKLGAASWQKRKAALKKRIQIAASELLKIAARRATRQAPSLIADNHSYSEFCARFAYAETDDQQRAIDEVLSDIASGKPMDRLICGDVGFGKTEVALRAAFAAVAGEERVQVAVIAPTTLLARQHYQTFSERFAGFNVTVRPLSRLVTSKAQTETKQGLKDGSVDIVIGTHALLAKSIEFARLGLVIVDEEQRFGVAQKERMKQLRANIHVLTLSATPIPRTLQMALTGVRELSLITTPPVDRLAIRSYVMPTDTMIIKEALLREYHRGGKSFVVTPRIEYIDGLQQMLRDLVPDLRVLVAHGQMPARELEDKMQAFYDGQADILLATTIIESGLDVQNANTLIIDNAQLFGLAQLYQLRGRVGRGKVRAYAYLTLPPNKKITDGARKRLEVMSQLDTLGAGFTLASHDMDIRGFGNLLGEEQSGHVREVGIELYQTMLEDTIRQLRSGEEERSEQDSDWSPTINLGATVLIPESYVEALDVRMQLYRRLATLQEDAELDAFAAELIDRFGTLPDEVALLLQVMQLKIRCKKAGIERIDSGPKAAIVSFRHNHFANPEALLRHIMQQNGRMRIRADQKLMMAHPTESPAPRAACAQLRADVEAMLGLLG